MNLSELLPNTQEAHAITVHLPVAISIIGVLVVAVALLLKTSKDVLRWSAVATYLLLAVTGYVAVETGEDARTEVSGAISPAIWEVIDEHEEMAEYVWMFAVGTSVLLLISIFTKGMTRLGTGIAAFALAIAAAVWVGLTGHYGGDLVYQYGIGIPPESVIEWRLNPPSEEELAAKAEEVAIAEAESAKDLIPITEIDPDEAAKVSWTRDVYPLLEEVCVECHTPPDDLDSEYDMTTVAALLIGGEKYGTSIVPGKPDESTLIKYVRGELLPQMPEDEMPLLREEVHMLREWIFAGAIDDSDNPPAE